MKEKIKDYYQKKYKEEVEQTGLKIPQTAEAKNIRKILKLVELVN